MKNLILTLILISTCINLLNAKVSLNGSYESSFTINRDNQDYKWQAYDPYHKVSLWFFADPVKNTEFFLKTYADSEREINSHEKRKAVYLDEAHVKYRWGNKDFIETYLFARETRFLLGNPLINLVNNDSDKWDDKNVSGFTYEMQGYIQGLYAKCFAAKMYELDTDTTGFRVYEKIINDKIHAGTTFAYKKWSGGKENYNVVYAGDVFFHIVNRLVKISGEYSKSKTPALITDTGDFEAYKVEFNGDMNLYKYIGNNLGDISYRLTYKNIGKDFRAYLSKEYDNDRKFDQLGYNTSIQYGFPIKAITLRYHRDNYKRHYENYKINDNQFEVYTEFIKGFRWKNYYQIYHELNTDKILIIQLDGTAKEVNFIDNTWRHYLTQLEMENKLAYVKLQFKIKNIYSIYLKYLYGVEYSIKITEKLKSINRLIIADEIYQTRKTLFSQIQYKYGDNTAFYLAYGEENDSNKDLVNDDGFVESDQGIVHKVHLYVKMDF